MSERRYRKNEFCIAMQCKYYFEKKKTCYFFGDKSCIFTAKQLHKWLKNNGFKIVKVE